MVNNENIVPVLDIYVRYEDVFDLKEFYIFVRDWLVAEGFADNKKDEYMEKLYFERISPQGFKEVWVWWRTEKQPHGSKFFKYKLDVDFQVLGMVDVEIIHKGVKIKAQKGEVGVYIKADIELNPEFMKFEFPVPFYKGFTDLFRRRIYRKEIEEHKRSFREDVYRLQDAIKRYLELRGFLPESELFQPIRGL